MAPISGSRLTPEEVESVRATGKEPHEGALPLQLADDNEILARVVSSLMACHWPGDFGFKPPFTDIVAACQFYRHASTEEIEAVESICETFGGLNVALSEKATSKSAKPKGYLQ